MAVESPESPMLRDARMTALIRGRKPVVSKLGLT
jgi:hypothetical protein